MSRPPTPPTVPATGISVPGAILRVGGAFVIVGSGLFAAWPFRGESRPEPAKPAFAAAAPLAPADSAQIVFQSPGQPAEAVPAEIPTRAPVRKTVAEQPAPALVSPVDLATTPPELAPQFAGIEGLAPRPAPSLPAAPEPRLDELPREHRLVDGDTLQRLAQRYLGDPQRWPEIQVENSALLTNPAVLPIGRTVRIPPRTRRWETSGVNTAPVMALGLK